MQFLLGLLKRLLLLKGLLLELYLLNFALVLLAALLRDVEEVLAQFHETDGAAHLIHAVVILGCLDHFHGLASVENNRFLYIDGAAQVGALICPSKFLEKPVEVLLLKAKVISLFELRGILLLNPCHFCLNLLLQVRHLSRHYGLFLRSNVFLGLFVD